MGDGGISEDAVRRVTCCDWQEWFARMDGWDGTTPDGLRSA